MFLFNNGFTVILIMIWLIKRMELKLSMICLLNLICMDEVQNYQPVISIWIWIILTSFTNGFTTNNTILNGKQCYWNHVWKIWLTPSFNKDLTWDREVWELHPVPLRILLHLVLVTAEKFDLIQWDNQLPPLLLQYKLEPLKHQCLVSLPEHSITTKLLLTD